MNWTEHITVDPAICRCCICDGGAADFEKDMRLTEAALQALLWFKRFAQSELKVEPGTEAE